MEDGPSFVATHPIICWYKYVVIGILGIGTVIIYILQFYARNVTLS
jgi:hypothetical protein